MSPYHNLSCHVGNLDVPIITLKMKANFLQRVDSVTTHCMLSQSRLSSDNYFPDWFVSVCVSVCCMLSIRTKTVKFSLLQIIKIISTLKCICMCVE